MTRFRLVEGKKTDGVGHGQYQVCIVRTKRMHVSSRCVGLNLKTVSISIIIKCFIMLFLSSLNAILQWRMSGVYLQSLALSEEENREQARQQHSSTEEVLRK